MYAGWERCVKKQRYVYGLIYRTSKSNTDNLVEHEQNESPPLEKSVRTSKSNNTNV